MWDAIGFLVRKEISKMWLFIVTKTVLWNAVTWIKKKKKKKTFFNHVVLLLLRISKIKKRKRKMFCRKWLIYKKRPNKIWKVLERVWRLLGNVVCVTDRGHRPSNCNLSNLCGRCKSLAPEIVSWFWVNCLESSLWQRLSEMRILKHTCAVFWDGLVFFYMVWVLFLSNILYGN